MWETHSNLPPSSTQSSPPASLLTCYQSSLDTDNAMTSNDEEDKPGNAPTHSKNNATGTIANTNANYQVSYKKYYSQPGAKDVLRDTIVTTTDLDLQCELKHKNWEYKKHTPL